MSPRRGTIHRQCTADNGGISVAQVQKTPETTQVEEEQGSGGKRGEADQQMSSAGATPVPDDFPYAVARTKYYGGSNQHAMEGHEVHGL